MQESTTSRVLILGSCVSRDIFEYQLTTERNFDLVGYYARSSLASLAASPYLTPLPSCLESIKSAFKLRMVKWDMCKDFYHNLATAQYDILLIDMIDERFNLWMSLDGCVCTLSSELVQTGFISHQKSGEEIVSGSDEFWRLWETGWVFFVQKLSDLGVLNRVRVNKVFWSTSTQSGCTFGTYYTPQRIASANKLLERMYLRIEENIPPHQFLVFDPPCLVAADSHKWGISPFHYVTDYYTAALKKLRNQPLAPQPDMALEDMGPKVGSEKLDDSTTTAYNISAWKMPVYLHESVNSAIADGIGKDGIHRVVSTGGKTLDLCAQNLSLLTANEEDKVILIGFSGAVSGRNGKKAPFFSGLGIARSLNLPIVAIADPTLALNPDLPLSWYAGSEEMPDFPMQLARVLDGLARQHKARLILFGGSGGGYAGLLMATLLECQATVLVSNPQTAIADYAPWFVMQYLEVAFPSLREAVAKVRSQAASKQGELLYKVLDATTITHDVRNIPLRPQIKLIYLQNQTDWHVAKHATPYFAKKSWGRIGQAAFIEQPSHQISLFFGQWGKGHAPLPDTIWKAVLKKLADGDEIVKILKALDSGLDGLYDQAPQFHWLTADINFKLTASAWVDVDNVHAICSAGNDTNGITYAFYLLVDGVRHSTRWYEPLSHIQFDRPNIAGKLEVLAFARNSIGCQMEIRVPVQPK